MTTPTSQNERGQWVPAIPLPFYVLWQRRCHCGEKFWTTKGYEGHYALVHLVGLGRRR